MRRAAVSSLIFALLLAGCGSGSSPAPAVTIRANGSHYGVVVDFSGRTHREVGRAFAEAIRVSAPGYEAAIDGLLAVQIAIVREAYGTDLPIGTLVGRAQAILASVPSDYVDEIRGMQEVFDYAVDLPGDGKLSANEFLVLQFFPDVLRPFSCSASAAFGQATVSGSTVLGRNLDWYTGTAELATPFHAVQTFRNGSRTTVNMTLLGMLSASSQFNEHRVFGAVLDGNTDDPYPTNLVGMRSYPFDLRYALENFSNVRDVAAHMETGTYAFNHNVFLADEDGAGVVENDMGMPGRGLRLAGSALQPGLEWTNPSALAVVNDFRLPGTTWDEDASNVLRWGNLRSLYADVGLPGGRQVDVDVMKGIAGFYGYDGNDWTTGALFLSSPAGYFTMQSIVLDTGTMELWVHFAPGIPAPLTPRYERVHHALEP